MARMRPESFEYSETNSHGEERVFNALRDKLDDEWLVCHSWRWLRHSLNDQTGKIQGEGDFVLFHPECGIIVIEVKGGTIEYRDDGKYYSNGNQIQNPEKQASDTKFDIIARLKENKLHTMCYVSHCVWFPDINWTINYPPNLNSRVLLDAKDLTNPESKIRSVVQVATKTISSEKIIKEIEELLHCSFKLVKALNFRIEDAVFEQVRLTQTQLHAFEYLREEKCMGVKGRAGTGKTLLAVNLAKQLADESEKVLYLCFNKGLAEFLKSELTETRIDVFTFHSYAIQYLTKYFPWRIDNEMLNSGDAPKYFNYLGSEFSEVIDENKDQYTACIIDEAQDLQPEWFESLKNTFFPEHKFYYFFDPLQVPYTKKIELNESYFSFGCVVIPLTRNMRNTRQVSQSALNILGETYDPKKHFSSLDGDFPEVILCDNDELEKLERKLIKLTIVEHIDKKDITILTMNAHGKSSVGEEVSGVDVTSFRKFKGLDNKIILIVDVDYKHFEDKVYQRELYMAITRSKYLTWIFINNKDSLMKKAFCERLAIEEPAEAIIKNILIGESYE